MLRGKYTKYFIIILTFLVFAGLSDIFIIHTHVLFSTDDMSFHLRRIMELYDSNRPLSFAINYFHGSAVMSMYPYLSLFPLVLLLHITSSYLYSYYYFYIFIIFIALLVAFFSSLKFDKSKTISYLFAILYSLSISFIIEYFHNGDLGITTSLVFIPMALFGTLDILNGSKTFVKLSLGLTFIALCQIPTIIIISAFVILLVIINIHKIKKYMFYEFLKAMLLTILLTSIVWIPLLKIILLNKIITPTSSQIQSANALSIIKNVGIIPIITSPILLLYFKKFNRIIKQMYCLSIFIIIISSQYVPIIKIVTSLKCMRFINTFQFTARFFIIPHVILCYLTSWLIVNWLLRFNHHKFSFIAIILSILILQILTQIFIIHNEFNQNYKYADSYESVRICALDNKYLIKDQWFKYLYDGYISNIDYYPFNTLSNIKYINNNEAIYGHRQTIDVKHIGYNRFSFNSSVKINQLMLPLIHYNGEHLRVYVNNHLVHYHTNGNNLITLSNVKKGKHQIRIKYVPNAWLVVLKTVMFFSGILWLLLICYNKMIRKNHGRIIKLKR